MTRSYFDYQGRDLTVDVLDFPYDLTAKSGSIVVEHHTEEEAQRLLAKYFGIETEAV